MRYEAVAALLVMSSCALAQTSHVQKDYDVRDLLIAIPDEMPGAAPGAQPASAAKAPAAASARLLAAVRAVLRDDPSAKATEAGGTLHVDAAPAQHEQVQAALEQARRARSTQILIEMRFIELDPAIIGTMDPDLQKAIDATGFDDAASLLTPEQRATLQNEARVARDTSPVPLEQVPMLKNDAEPQTPKVQVLSSPKVTAFQGQRASVFIGNETSYVRDMKANPAPNAKEPFVPDIATFEGGLSVELRASCDETLSTVSVEARPKISQLLSLTSEVWPKSPPGQTLYVQVPHLRVQSADQLLTLTSGQSALMRLRVTDGEPVAGKTHLFFIVTPTIIQMQ